MKAYRFEPDGLKTIVPKQRTADRSIQNGMNLYLSGFLIAAFVIVSDN